MQYAYSVFFPVCVAKKNAKITLWLTTFWSVRRFFFRSSSFSWLALILFLFCFILFNVRCQILCIATRSADLYNNYYWYCIESNAEKKSPKKKKKILETFNSNSLPQFQFNDTRSMAAMKWQKEKRRRRKRTKKKSTPKNCLNQNKWIIALLCLQLKNVSLILVDIFSLHITWIVHHFYKFVAFFVYRVINRIGIFHVKQNQNHDRETNFFSTYRY